MRVAQVTESWIAKAHGLPPAQAKEFDKPGQAWIGSGRKSKVFSCEGGRVRKVMYDDPCYLEYATRIKGSSNPYFPKIYSIEPTEDGGHVIEMEELRKLKMWDREQKLKKWTISWLVTWYDMRQMKMVTTPRTGYQFMHVAKLWRDLDPFEIKEKEPDLWHAAWVVWKMIEDGCNADMKTWNLMVRCDGHLVMTDPVA